MRCVLLHYNKIYLHIQHILYIILFIIYYYIILYLQVGEEAARVRKTAGKKSVEDKRRRWGQDRHGGNTSR